MQKAENNARKSISKEPISINIKIFINELRRDGRFIGFSFSGNSWFDGLGNYINKLLPYRKGIYKYRLEYRAKNSRKVYFLLFNKIQDGESLN